VKEKGLDKARFYSHRAACGACGQDTRSRRPIVEESRIYSKRHYIDAENLRKRSDIEVSASNRDACLDTRCHESDATADRQVRVRGEQKVLHSRSP
jgi:hypothetical protein